MPKCVTWEEFCDFTSAFREIGDQDVAPRYRYGELRLSRLNYLVKIFMIGSSYQEVNWQYSEYFARFYGPLLFFWGAVCAVECDASLSGGATAAAATLDINVQCV